MPVLAEIINLECDYSERMSTKTIYSQIQNEYFPNKKMFFSINTLNYKVYEMDGSEHSLFKVTTVDDTKIDINIYEDTAKFITKGSMSINRYTGFINARMITNSKQKTSFGSPVTFIGQAYSGTCKPYTMKKAF